MSDDGGPDMRDAKDPAGVAAAPARVGAFGKLSFAAARSLAALAPKSRKRYGGYGNTLSGKLAGDLGFAARMGDMEGFGKALARGAPVDAIWRDDQMPPIGEACHAGKNAVHTVSMLLDLGVDPGKAFPQHGHGMVFPMQAALRSCNWDAALVILDRLPAGSVGRPMLEWLAEGCSWTRDSVDDPRFGHMHAFFDKMAALADPSCFLPQPGQVGLIELCAPNVVAIGRFAALGAQVGEVSSAGHGHGSAMHKALAYGSPGCVARLLELGASPSPLNMSTSERVPSETPLAMLARTELSRHGRLEVAKTGLWRRSIQLLLSAGAMEPELDAVVDAGTRRVLGLAPLSAQAAQAASSAAAAPGVSPMEQGPDARDSSAGEASPSTRAPRSARSR